MATIKKKPTKKEVVPKMTFGPCSEKQRIILQDTTTDVILMGGKQHCLPFKTTF